VKYLTTLQAAREFGVSKQTLLNWLRDKRVPEPTRDRNGHRLWSPARVLLVRRLIEQGRLHSRTVVHAQASNAPDAVEQYAREVGAFLREGRVEPEQFLRALARRHRGVAALLRQRPRRSGGERRSR
jgi:DNA-binding transcriptional MerR regulator